MNSAESRATYDVIAEDYASHFPGTEPEAPLDLAMIDHFISLLPARTRTVLDAGCGTGRMGRYLADHGCAVRGSDLSPGMLAMARRDHPDIDTVHAGHAELPFADSEFDGVLYWYSLIHAADDELPAILAEAARVTSEDGLLLIAFQVGAGVQEVGESLRALGHDVRLERMHRSVEEMTKHLVAAGFCLVAQMQRAAVGSEKGPQAALIASRTAGTADSQEADRPELTTDP